jgi:hypothetical protein
MDLDLPVNLLDLLSWVGLVAGALAFLSAGLSALLARTPTESDEPAESIRGVSVKRPRRSDAHGDASVEG